MQNMIQKIKTILEKQEHNYYGLRTMTPSPDGTPQIVEVGGYVENSYDWDEDGNSTGKELNGVCAVQIRYFGEDVEIKKAIEKVMEYHVEGEQLVMLGSRTADNGNDPFEVVMSEGDVVLASWEEIS